MSERTFVKPASEAGDIEFIRPSALAAENKTGVLLEGVYQGSLENNFDTSKSDYKFEKEDGTTVVINHSGSLAKQMNSILPGTFVQVSYNGKITIEKGKMKGKEAHDFLVLVEDSASA